FSDLFSSTLRGPSVRCGCWYFSTEIKAQESEEKRFVMKEYMPQKRNFQPQPMLSMLQATEIRIPAQPLAKRGKSPLTQSKLWLALYVQERRATCCVRVT
ncbi:MAG: hypothetical protein ABJI00_14285, partial [Paracoccaceae bacterium]